jgi:hypothetical protein
MTSPTPPVAKVSILIPVLLIGVALFTIIEVVTLGAWFGGSTPPVVFSTAGQIKLVLGLFIEHLVSAVVGVAVVAGLGNIRFTW